MVATANLLYRMNIDGDEQVKAAIAAVGTAEEQAAARAVAAADRKADRAAEFHRRYLAAAQASQDADQKALAFVTGGALQYEAAKRRELVAEQTVNRERARTTVSVGQLRAASQQLSFQIGDVAQQFAAGTPPMVIFAQQGGQVVQALSLMTTGSKGLIGFLGGPWGQAIMAGGILLLSLTSKLWDNADASKAAEAGNNGLRDAQSALGDMFDLTSGKLKEQNSLLRLNALLTASKLRAEGKAEEAASRSVFRQAGNPTTSASILAFFDRSGYGAGQFASDALRRNAADQRALLEAIEKAPNQAARDAAYTAASKYAETRKKAFEGQPYTADQFQQALINRESGPGKIKSADEIERSLASGELAPGLRRDAPDRRDRRERKPRQRADNSVGLERRYDRELAQMESEHLALMARMTPSIDERARIAALRLDQDQAAYAEDIALRVKSKDLTQAQADQLLTQRQVNVTLQKQQAAMEFQAERLNEEARLRDTMTDIEEDRLRTARELAVSASQAREIELRMVDLQYDRERAALQNIIEMGKLNKATAAEVEAAQRRLDALPERQAADQDRARRGTMGPMESYMDQLSRDAQNLNEQFEGIAVRGLQSLNDGLVEVIMNSKSLGDMFSNVAEQIIGDILRIAVQQTLIKPLLEALGGSVFGAGGLGGLFGGGKGGASSLVDDGSLKAEIDAIFRNLPFGGGPIGLPGFATGTHHFGGGAAMVGERGPEMALFPRGTRIVPANDTAKMMGGAPMSVHIDASIHAPGADPAALARVEEQQRQMMAEFPRIALEAVADAQQRMRRPLGLAA